MPIVRRSETRRTETPNAVMTTLASPSLGEASQPLWKVEMQAGQTGPIHTISAEQIWTLTGGGATFEISGETFTVEAGDTVIVPAGALRRIHSDPADGLSAFVVSTANARAALLDGTDKGVPAWTG
jgi:quercetin dioxygenase-like cupin family protein